MPLSAKARGEILAAKERYPSARSAVLPALWAVQNEAGFLSEEGLAEVASMLQLAPSEVQAVSTFYSMYFSRPAGAHHVLVCVNVSCALRGGDDIVSHLERRLGCPSGGTSVDGKFTWESTVECLGACGGAPAMQIDHHFHENLTTDSVDGILERIAAQPDTVGRHGRDGAPEEGPHPPTAETPPAATAEGPPSEASATGDGSAPSAAASSPAVERTQLRSPAKNASAKPTGSRSAPRRRRPRPDAGDL